VILELALWITVGLLLSVVGYTWEHWQFWCLAGTYWAVALLSRNHGKIEGIIDYLEMTEQDQHRIKQALKTAKEQAK
jgi:hypothetical protein